MVGRDRDLDEVRALLHEAALGTGAITFFAGPDGCGKSRLLRACEAISTSAVVLTARCSPVAIPGEEIRAQFAKQLGVRNIAANLAKLVKEKPVAALVDDVHLASEADLETLDALVFLASRYRLLLVGCLAQGTARSPAVSARLGRWLSAGAHYRQLAPLDDRSMTLLVRGLLHERGAAVDGATLREIIEASEGIPRFAVELAQQAKTTANLADLVPASAQIKLDAARSSLNARVFDLLLLCSAVGTRFRDSWIAQASRLPHASVAAALQAACDAGILCEDRDLPGWFAFEARAVQRAVYRSIVSMRRRMLHERIVARLTSTHCDVLHAAMLARQWSALGDDATAAEWFARAADEYSASSRLAEAAPLYREALRRTATESERWGTLAHSLLKCYRRIGEFEPIIPLVESIRRNGALGSDAKLASEVMSELLYAHLNNGDREAARRVVLDIKTVCADDGLETVEAATLVLAYAFHAGGQRAEAAELLARVDTKKLASDEARFRYCVARAVIGAHRETLDVLLDSVENAATFGGRVGKAGPMQAYIAGSYVGLCRGDLPVARAYAAKAADIPKNDRKAPTVIRHEVAKNLAFVHLVAGELAEARGVLFSQLDWRDSGHYNEAHFAGIGVAIGIRTGDVTLIDAFFDPALLDQALIVREAELCGLLLSSFAEVMTARGMTTRFQYAIQTCLTHHLSDPYGFIHVCAAQYGQPDVLEQAEHRAAAYHTETGGIARAHLALVRAVVNRRKGALGASHEHALRAARAYAQIGWRLREALALELAGETQKAMTIYTDCGATADVARVATAQTRKLRRSPFGARLTAREREVASLLARKRSDKQIAHVLQISVRTVHHHVEAILSKLGVPDRSNVTESLLD